MKHVSLLKEAEEVTFPYLVWRSARNIATTTNASHTFFKTTKPGTLLSMAGNTVRFLHTLSPKQKSWTWMINGIYKRVPHATQHTKQWSNNEMRRITWIILLPYTWTHLNIHISYMYVFLYKCFLNILLQAKKHVTNWRMFIWPSHKRSMRSKKGMKNIPYTDMLHMPTLTWICQYVCTYIPTNTFQMLSTKAAQRTGTFWKYPPRNHMFHMLHLPITSAVSIRHISRNIPS